MLGFRLREEDEIKNMNGFGKTMAFFAGAFIIVVFHMLASGINSSAQTAVIALVAFFAGVFLILSLE